MAGKEVHWVAAERQTVLYPIFALKLFKLPATPA